MNRFRLLLPGLVVLCAALALAAIVAAVTSETVIRQAVFSAGGDTAAGGNARVSGVLGQPVTGRASGPSTELFGGWWSAVGSAGSNSDSYIPLLFVSPCADFDGTQECEDNDRPSQANGPLQFGLALTGELSDANENDIDENTEDWFFFQWSGEGFVSIGVTGFAPVGQVILYYESIDQGAVISLDNQSNGVYQITYDGQAGAGLYLIRLFVPGADRLAGAPDYSLLVTN